ncbi:amidohydrolase family protein [Arvimicrobium flavum]|uniref:amidohydrolase family protein n=1 Tax=Arvimicrobium flavum TaxID=3393320 RepID=UPI00237A99CD|nr:amidohydrolase family protein [Mesorhizobium shangrilense]
MSEITRKEFLRLGAAGAAAIAVASTNRPAPAVAAARGAARATLIRGADVLTMDQKLGELPGADVLIRDGKIAEIGIGINAGDAELIDAAGMILMPGMNDGHRHLWLGLHAGRLVKTDPQKYSGYQRWKMRTMVCMTPEDFHLAGYVGGLQAINSGVTSVLDYAHAHHTKEKALAGARGFVASGVSGVFCYQASHNPTYGPGDTVPEAQATAERNGAPQESNYETAALLRDLFSEEGDGPVKFGIAISEGLGRRSMTDMKREFERARSFNPHLICCHLHKPNPMPPSGVYRGIADLHAAGLLGPDFQVSHGVEMSDDELVMLRDSGGMICSCAMGEFPYPAASIHGKARQMGIPAGLGLDVNMALTDDYFEHVRAGFWSLYRSVEYAGIARAYQSADVLDFATRWGAKAMRLGDAGSIAVGNHADLVLLKTSRIGFATCGSLADRVVNFAGLSDIDSVWVRGVARKRHGEMIGIDWASLRAQMVDAQQRIERDAATVTLT